MIGGNLTGLYRVRTRMYAFIIIVPKNIRYIFIF